MSSNHSAARPAVAVDVVLLDAQGRHILLIRRRKEPFAGLWALPGGFVEAGEDLDDAARRELAEETGVLAQQLQQVRAFGRPERDPRGHVISIAYRGVAPDCATPRAGSDADEVRWFSLKALPALAFDHAEIISAAVAGS